MWNKDVPHSKQLTSLEGSIPSSSAKINKMKKEMNTLIKQLQNLYSWNQFYQGTNNKTKMKIAQNQINKKKREINELKTKKK